MADLNDPNNPIRGAKPDPKAQETISRTVIAIVIGLIVVLGLGFFRYNNYVAKSNVPDYISSKPQAVERAMDSLNNRPTNVPTAQRRDIQNTATTPDTVALPRPVQKAINNANS